MACPQYSRDHNDCVLLEEPPRDEEERSASPAEEAPRRDWCLVPDKSYRNCPVYRRYLAELIP